MSCPKIAAPTLILTLGRGSSVQRRCIPWKFHWLCGQPYDWRARVLIGWSACGHELKNQLGASAVCQRADGAAPGMGGRRGNPAGVCVIMITYTHQLSRLGRLAFFTSPIMDPPPIPSSSEFSIQETLIPTTDKIAEECPR